MDPIISPTHPDSPQHRSPTLITLNDTRGMTSISRISNSLAMYHASVLFNASAFITPSISSTTLTVSPSSVRASFKPSKIKSCQAVKALFSEGGNGSGNISLYPQSCIACAAFLSDMRLVTNMSSLSLEATASSASASSSSSSSSSASDPAALIQPTHHLLMDDMTSTKKSTKTARYLGNSPPVNISLSPLAARGQKSGIITPLSISPLAARALILNSSSVASGHVRNKSSFMSHISTKSDATVALLQSTLLRTKNLDQPFTNRPRAVLTPVFFADPPDWKTDSVNACDIPPTLNDLFFPLPQRASDNLAITVCIPFYSEDGYALRRGLEAIVCQRADFRRYFAHCHSEIVEKQGGLPELHVFAVADGWRQGGGSNGAFILSDGMFAELAAIFGDTLDVDELVRLLEMPEIVNSSSSSSSSSSNDTVEADDIESNLLKAPKGVLIQFALNKTLAPVWLDVSWAQSMECRAQEVSGLAALAMAEAIKKHSSTGDDASRKLVYSADKCSADKEQPIFFSLYIKRHNAKKHHSHRLFLEAFAPIYRIRSKGFAQYNFLTDCGTLYARFMLAELYHHMESHPFCAASTGHQRIMNRQDQADPLAIDAEPFAQSFLRQVQSFDFEAGLCVFNGMHELIGYLPVVPGPCAFFRSSAISHQRIELLRDIISSPPHLDGIIQGNLKIAEDRILSFILLMNLSSLDGASPTQDRKPSSASSTSNSQRRDPSSSWSTEWVLSTCFYFESEETLKELVMQRRRWLNGTTAGNIWLLSHKILRRDLSRGSLMAFKVLILSCFQMLVFAITALLPGLTIVVGAISISGLTLMISIAFPLLLIDASDTSSNVQAVFLTISFASLFAHAGFARFGPRNYEPSIWMIRCVLNALVTVIVAATSLVLVAFVAIAPSQLEMNTGEQSFKYIVATLLTSAFVATSPFFLTYMHSRKSFIRSISTFPGYLLFSTTVLSDFYMYSLNRADDVSWGTKSTLGGSRKAQGTNTDAAQARLVAAGRSRALAAFGSSDNGSPIESEASALVTEVRSKMNRQRQFLKKSAKAREKMFRITNVIAIVQMIACVALVAINIALEKVVAGYLLYAGVTLGVISTFIQLLSFVFFVKRALIGKASGTLLERTFQVINFLGWLALLCCVCTVLISEVKAGIEWRQAATLFSMIYSGLIVCAFIRFCTSATVSLAAEATNPFDKDRRAPSPSIDSSLSNVLSITHLSAANDFADAFLVTAEARINVALCADASVRSLMLMDVITTIQDEVESMLSLDLGSTKSNAGKFLFLPPREYARVSSKLSTAIVNLTTLAMEMAVSLESAEEAAAAQTILLINVIDRVVIEMNDQEVEQKRAVLLVSINDAIATLQADVLDLAVSLDVAANLCALMRVEAEVIVNQWEVKVVMKKEGESVGGEGESVGGEGGTNKLNCFEIK